MCGFTKCSHPTASPRATRTSHTKGAHFKWPAPGLGLRAPRFGINPHPGPHYLHSIPRCFQSAGVSKFPRQGHSPWIGKARLSRLADTNASDRSHFFAFVPSANFRTHPTLPGLSIELRLREVSAWNEELVRKVMLGPFLRMTQPVREIHANSLIFLGSYLAFQSRTKLSQKSSVGYARALSPGDSGHTAGHPMSPPFSAH